METITRNAAPALLVVVALERRPVGVIVAASARDEVRVLDGVSAVGTIVSAVDECFGVLSDRRAGFAPADVAPTRRRAA